MRNMIRWQPINRPVNWNAGIDRLFNEFMGRSLSQVQEETAACAWTPAVNILEREDGIVITADLPGLKAEDVEVTIDNGVLTSRANGPSKRLPRARPTTALSAATATSSATSRSRTRWIPRRSRRDSSMVR